MSEKVYEQEITHWKGYAGRGKLIFEHTLKGNLFVGESKLYHENGKIKEVINYKIEDGESLKDGEYTSYYKNGKIKEKGIYRENKKEGEWLEYSEIKSNEIIKKATYKDNVKIAEEKSLKIRSRARAKGNER